MLYREAGQFNTTYAADQQLFPIRQDRIGMAILLAVAFVGVPLVSVVPEAAAAIDLNYWFNGMLIPFLLLACRSRLEHPHGLRRTALARHRRVHGCGGFRRLQLRAPSSGHADAAVFRT